MIVGISILVLLLVTFAVYGWLRRRAEKAESDGDYFKGTSPADSVELPLPPPELMDEYEHALKDVDAAEPTADNKGGKTVSNEYAFRLICEHLDWSTAYMHAVLEGNGTEAERLKKERKDRLEQLKREAEA